MQQTLNGKWALVCGASQGIGAASAAKLAAQGANLILLARNSDKLKKMREQLPRSTDHKILAIDIADRTSLRNEVVDIQRSIGPIHILICNTGGPKAGPVIAADETEFLRGFENHVLVNSLLVQSVWEGMRDAGYGRILNIISTSVKTPIPNLGVSNTIRGAVANWAKTLANELAPHGITVNNVLPGYTETERLAELAKSNAARANSTVEQVREGWLKMIPMNRFGRPEEVAAAIAFLASPEASYITGINLPVDGGRTPSL